MENAVTYEIDPVEDEARRPGFSAILDELRNGYPNETDDWYRAQAKLVWHDRNNKKDR